MIPRTSLACLLASGALVASCAGAHEKARPSAPAAEPAVLGASYSSPATWRYHPTEQADVTAELDLGKGQRLLVGRRGERWIYEPATKALRAGAALAPEDLVAVMPSPEQSYWFVGASGTTYEAREPLGPFVRSSAPFDTLAEVTAGRGTLLGVRFDRRLMRSTDGGASWNPALPEASGLVDVEMTPDGHVLLLGLPERLWESSDAGATFKPLAQKARGVLSLERDPASGEVRAVTPLGAELYRPGAAPPLQPVPQLAKAKPSDVPDPPRGPNAGAVAEGRAVFSAGEYFEAEQVDEAKRSWVLWRGKLDQALEKTELPEAKGCESLRFAHFAGVSEFACFRGSAENTSQPVELYRREAAEKFERETFTPYGSLVQFKLALGQGGALIVSGVCASTASSQGCAPNGVHYRRPARPGNKKRGSTKALPEIKPAEIKSGAPQFELSSAATPSLVDVALGLAYSVDGKLAYALGRSGKTGQLVIFVSSDGGSTFEPQELDLAGLRDQDYGDPLDGASVDSLVPAEDGSVGIVLARYRSRTLVVTDELGRLLSAAKPSQEFSLLGAAGARALGVNPARGQVWESLDGGATWSSAGRLPADPCAGDGQCDLPVQCSPEGCVLGHELSRIGWGGQADEELGSLSPGSEAPKEALERRIQTPLECLLATTPFKPLPGVGELPDAGNAALGKAAWFAAAPNVEQASALVYHGIAGAKPRVETATLLPPTNRSEGYAFSMVNQVEGAAAIRYLVPSGSERRITNVEIGWDNLFEGRVGQARLRDAGLYLNGDATRISSRAYFAQPDLISISDGGLYLRPHATPKDRQITYFVDGSGNSVELPPIAWPEALLSQSRAEMMHAGSAHLGVLFYGQGAAVIRARREGSGWAFDAGATGLANAAAFRLMQSLRISYIQGRAALGVEFDDFGTGSGSAQVYPLQGDGEVLGAPLPLPTQADLPAEPRPCSAEERRDTPRIVANFLPGTRRPLLITDAVDAPRLMLTGSAVLHGPPSNPCAAAYDAEQVPSDGASPLPETAIVLLDDLEHAWLFRLAQSSSGEAAIVEYRNMSCRFSPTAEVPSELFRVPGTLAPRRQGARTPQRPAGE